MSSAKAVVDEPMDALATTTRHCVYLVDDDDHLRALVRRWLEEQGNDVVEFSTGEAALEGLSVREPDVILLDLHMPGAGGVSTLQRIKARHRFLPVVVLTVERDVKTVVQTMQIGAYDFLVKPLDRAKLASTVDNAIENHRMSVRIAELEKEVEGGNSGLVGNSEAMRELNRQIGRLSGTDVSVYIHGESGTGKELVARAIHESSSRSDGPFVAINCAAIPESLQESELFGHEKGSFTGAANKRLGKFELADRGTLFLDEVADLSASAQSKLLRVLQERRVLRVGGSQEIPLDFRILAATHRDLLEEVRRGRFREDLYFRIVVFELKVPPLREREGDIATLCDYFLDRFARASDERAELSAAALNVMSTYGWPGNVRELENAVQRAVVTCENHRILPTDLPPSILDAVHRSQHGIPDDRPSENSDGENGAIPSRQPALSPEHIVIPPRQTLAQIERQVIEHTMAVCDNNRSRVAQRLGIGRTTLYRKLKEYELESH